ncbi:MAG: acyltransferase family protein [Bacillota bacterium]
MNRRHDIDALRALAFAFLILFHVGMLYVAGWDWHIKSSYTTSAIEPPMLFLNRWRMDLIFLISGAATAFMMRGASLGAFTRQRVSRLLVPLAFAMVVVIPIQPYCQGVANGLVEPGFGRFLIHYFTGYKWPANAFDGWQYGFTWNHLWYLPYLLTYTLVLVALQPLLRSKGARRVRETFVALRGWKLLVFPALPLVLFAIALSMRFEATHALFNDWYNHARYFTAFLYGWWLASSIDVWGELARLRKVSLGFAVIAFAAYFALRADNPSTPLLAIVLTFRGFFVWLAIATALGWGHACLNRPFKWLPFATEAVYPWYILHQSLIVLIAFWIVPMKLGPVLEPLIVTVGTVGGCWALHVGFIRRFGWLRACFGIRACGRALSSRSVRPSPAQA